MARIVTSEPIPLARDADDGVRVGGTHGPLDIVIAALHEGATAEAMRQPSPALPLADSSAVIGFYLRHTANGDSSLRQRQERTAATQTANATRFNPTGMRAPLLARRGTSAHHEALG